MACLHTHCMTLHANLCRPAEQSVQEIVEALQPGPLGVSGWASEARQHACACFLD